MDEQRKIVIKAEGLKKKYRLGAIGGRTLQAELQSRWARKRGKEDPNLRIGTDARQIGKEFWALNGVDLTVYEGERIGIIGMNGAGKSTLLKLISRITAPTEGDIYLWGRVSSLLEIGTGFHGELTGRENIYMNGAILGMKRAEIDEKIQQIIEFSEIENYIDTPIKRYSSGMFVKLAFAVAAFLNSEILIMDEVLAVGDVAFQKKCLDKMRQAADDEGKTILYVSHNMETIRRLCQRCIVLYQGKIIYDGDVEQAIAIYLGNNSQDDPVDINLKGKSFCESDDLVLERVRLIGKMKPLYTADESLNMQLSIRSNAPTKGLTLGVIFSDMADKGIASSWSQPFELSAAGCYYANFDCPLSQFAKGKFYVSLGLCQGSELGNILYYQDISRAFQIEVIGSPFWRINTYGPIKLKEVNLNEISAVQEFLE